MRLRRLEKTLPHEVDIKGTAVALAFLVSVGLFAGGQNDHGAAEPQPSHAASIPIPSTPILENSGNLQQLNDLADHAAASRTVGNSH